MSPLWIGLLVVVVAALVFLSLLLFLGRSRHLARSRSARLAHLGRLSARLWTSWLGATLRRLFAGPERRVRIDEARRKADAARITETMGHMKGAFMKLGQMMSFINEDIPEEYRAALASLQAQAPPMDFALLRDVAERELGKPLERAFASFDDQPIAAASIGQVHRAVLPTGEEVVVKIQYPGVAEAIRHDLANAEVLYRAIMLFYPGVEPAPIVDELRSRIMEELDYENELRSQAAFHSIYGDHPFIRVPRVYPSHSSPRVLTSEYIAGRRFQEVVGDDDDARARYAEIIYRFVFGSIIRFGVFNGDPHPGNYLFDDQGRVAFLDYGCVKYFDEALLGEWTALVSAHLGGDRDAFKALLLRLNFFRDAGAIDADTIYEYFGHFYEPFRSDRDFRFSHQYTASTFRLVFRPEGRFAGLEKHLNMPKDFVFVNRIQWGVYAILTQLNGHGNFHRIDSEYRLGRPPSTPLGEADARHHAAWRERHQFPGGKFTLTRDGARVRAPFALP